jgi:hypothetical protein
MRWLSLLWTTMTLLMTVSIATAVEIDGFRSFKWGSNLDLILSADPKLVEGHMGVMPGVKAFQRTDEDLDFGGIRADAITYTFYKDRFNSVSIDFRGIDNFEKLLVYCKKTFGPVTGGVVSKLEQYAGFDSPKTGAMLIYQLSMQTTNYGRLYLYSKELLQ